MIPADKNKADIIIAGGGAAGLSLAYKLAYSRLSHLNILVIDQDAKKNNDRTWCFWGLNDNIFPEIVYKSWDRILVKTKSSENRMEIHPYRYQMIRGIDFYNHVLLKLAEKPNIKFIREKINLIQDQKMGATVTTTHGTYFANLVFNSLPKPIPENISQNQNFLLQHFKGYIIETPQKNFDPDLVRFMDFDVPQEKEARFGYVLPLSETSALIEFTIFSEKLLNESEYTHLLKSYIRSSLNIQDYRIIEEEFGIIPMTDITFKKKEGERIYNIGSRGGMTKASTGYTFKQIQDECDGIVNSLEKEYPKLVTKPFKTRYRFYDSILLHVLAGNLYPANQIFSRLFLRNKPQQILKFLEEKTNIFEDLKVLLSLPSIPFMKAAFRTLFYRGSKKNPAKYSIERYLKK